MNSCHDKILVNFNLDIKDIPATADPCLVLQRDKIVQCFHNGSIWILICTELMGRGIDFKGVNLVINYDFPNSAVSYIHRIGPLWI